MTERERLADLIDDYMQIEGSFNIMDMADYLLSNGVIVPPVKIGDDIYIIYRRKVVGYKIHHITVFNNALDMYYQFYEKRDKCNHYASFRERDIGRCIFLTREEAEKALKEREEK